MTRSNIVSARNGFYAAICAGSDRAAVAAGAPVMGVAEAVADAFFSAVFLGASSSKRDGADKAFSIPLSKISFASKADASSPEVR